MVEVVVSGADTFLKDSKLHYLKGEPAVSPPPGTFFQNKAFGPASSSVRLEL